MNTQHTWIYQAVQQGGILEMEGGIDGFTARMRWPHLGEEILSAVMEAPDAALDDLERRLLDDCADEMARSGTV